MLCDINVRAYAPVHTRCILVYDMTSHYNNARFKVNHFTTVINEIVRFLTVRFMCHSLAYRVKKLSRFLRARNSLIGARTI